MPSFDPNWPRWIKASLDKVVDANKGPYLIFHEGQNRPSPWPPKLMEFRIATVDIRETTKDFWRIEVEAQLICATALSTDFFAIDRMTGDACAILQRSVPVYKWGDGSGDDPTVQIGCLTWWKFTDGVNTPIHHFGQVDTTNKRLEATVAAKYYIEFP